MSAAPTSAATPRTRSRGPVGTDGRRPRRAAGATDRPRRALARRSVAVRRRAARRRSPGAPGSAPVRSGLRGRRSRTHRSRIARRGRPRGAPSGGARLAIVSHPSLGLPPRDPTAGWPDAARTHPRRRAASSPPERCASRSTRPDARDALRRDRPSPAPARRRAARRAGRALASPPTTRRRARVRRLDRARLSPQARPARRPDQPVRGPPRRLPSVLAPAETGRRRMRRSTRPSRIPLASPPRRRRAQAQRLPPVASTRAAEP